MAFCHSSFSWSKNSLSAESSVGGNAANLALRSAVRSHSVPCGCIVGVHIREQDYRLPHLEYGPRLALHRSSKNSLTVDLFNLEVNIEDGSARAGMNLSRCRKVAGLFVISPLDAPDAH